MITIKDAYQKILSKHPDEYVHVANEYESVYGFILLHKRELATDTLGLLMFSTVDKHTGNITDDLLLGEGGLNGPYKQYTQKDLEGL